MIDLINTLEEKVKLCEEDLTNLKGTVKHIPFSMYAKSNGIVNFNGNVFGLGNSIYTSGQEGSNNNWQFPKLENPPLSNVNANFLSGFSKEDKEITGFEKSNILVSANCFKHAMFNQEIGLNNVEDAKIWLTSSKGLLNGFVLAKTGNNSHRTSPIYLSDLYTSFVRNENDLQKLIDFNDTDFSKEHCQKNGKLKLETRLQDTNQKGIGYTQQLNSVLKHIFYKSDGVINLEQLQFINIGGELGRDSVSNINEKNIEEIKIVLTLFLNNLRKNLINSNYLSHPCFYDFLKHLKQEENEIVLEIGCFRKFGDISQLEDESLRESGILLNKTAMVVLILQYFNLMLNTVILKNHAKLETLFIDVELPQIEEIPLLFKRTFDFKLVEKEINKSSEKESKKNKK